jgi:type I restriction enzyme S subunit
MSVSAWSKVSLGDVLQEVSRPEPVIADKTYRILGMRWYAKGLFVKDEKLGEHIKANKVYRVEEGDIIYNRLFAWKGSFGVAGSEFAGCYVSNEFPCFKADKKRIDSTFLWKYLSQQKIWKKIESHSTGSSRQSRLRLKEEQFLALKMLLPESVEEQERIVTRIDAVTSTIKKAQEFRQVAVKELGALMTVARRKIFGETPTNDWIPLSHYVESIENGWSPACESRPANSDEWGVVKVGCVTSGSYNPRENKALPSHLQPVPRYEIRTGDFLMSRANTSELVGACAVVEETPSKLMLSDKIFRFIFRDTMQIDPRYLNHVLKSPALRKQIERAATGTSPTMKNISKGKVLRLLIPKHDLIEQQRICAYLDDLQGKVSAIKRVQDDSSVELNAITSSILDKAFKGNL